MGRWGDDPIISNLPEAFLMTDTFRAMCAELAEELVNEYSYCTEWEKGLPLCESMGR
jgi:hypothetical protein